MSKHDTASTKTILYAFLANFGIAIAKGIGTFITGSGSMLAETIHSLADSGNQILLFIGIKESKKAPSKDYPFGHGKAIYFWSFIVAMVLFSLGGMFSIYEGIEKIKHGGELNHPYIALAILGVSILLEGSSFYGASKETKKLIGRRKLSNWISDTRRAEIMIVLGEDLAAIVGLSLAFIFLLISTLTGNVIYDAIGSVCIGAVLLLVSVFLIKKTHGLLIGKSADPNLVRKIRQEINEAPYITDIYNIITLQFGFDVILAAKVKMKSTLKIREACKRLNILEDNIQDEFPEVKWIFLEPDISKD